ncbi:hypothetical protein T01_10071 [Trichinella spiralis]|uniref:Uncharacterized protein n=1 Tax=Trichinella spiralis TaxID=6334 RepID=A0A0V1BR41_TRISP|nr:hypothetical protein T01_10071 [Trichinella spiralis]
MKKRIAQRQRQKMGGINQRDDESSLTVRLSVMADAKREAEVHCVDFYKEEKEKMKNKVVSTNKRTRKSERIALKLLATNGNCCPRLAR